jgi:peptidyl-tRNA hydrolase
MTILICRSATLRVQRRGGSGHRGLASMIERFGNGCRVRVGISRPALDWIRRVRAATIRARRRLCDRVEPRQ